MKSAYVKKMIIAFFAIMTIKSHVYAEDMAIYKIEDLYISEAFLVSSGSQSIKSYNYNAEKVTSVTSNTHISSLCNGTNKNTCYMTMSPVPSVDSEARWGTDNGISLSDCIRISGSVPILKSFRVRNSDMDWFDLSGNTVPSKFYVATNGVLNKEVKYAYNYSFDPNYTLQCPSNADELNFVTNYGGYGYVYNENTGANKRGTMGYSARFKLIRQGAVASLEISPTVLSCNGIIDKIISCGETFLNMSRPPSTLTVTATSSIPENLELFLEDGTSSYNIDTTGYKNVLSNTAKELKVYARSNTAYKGEISLNIEATWY
ncbi:hypothetical protein MZB74_22990 [Escherichia coli]|uniref:hypothetical protein n=1 Tax=Escherichia coli TaxID=562 RepID=UPI001375427E|nr:hypothetical protein [Escherichia coli]MBZ9527272.1 hypothetical protein [Escherichia coli]MCQ5478110.1 hypothetical protein [Escherichia coli]MCQ5483172.1 hypothetical protein [Escherichia coli]MCQ5487821.1 hypothetical protein [Escherichia coli]MCQ5493249.1 hypothetical protein [Escherichia coli]